MTSAAAATAPRGHGLRGRPRELAHDQGAHHASFFVAWLGAMELVRARRECGGPTRPRVGLRLDLDGWAIDHEIVNQRRAAVVERDVHRCVGAYGQRGGIEAHLVRALQRYALSAAGRTAPTRS